MFCKVIKGIHFENVTVKLRLKRKRNPENWGNHYREIHQLRGGEDLPCFVWYRESSGEREARGDGGKVRRSWVKHITTWKRTQGTCRVTVLVNTILGISAKGVTAFSPRIWLLSVLEIHYPTLVLRVPWSALCRCLHSMSWLLYTECLKMCGNGPYGSIMERQWEQKPAGYCSNSSKK